MQPSPLFANGTHLDHLPVFSFYGKKASAHRVGYGTPDLVEVPVYLPVTLLFTAWPL